MEKYCTHCGKELNTGAKFCAKCGTQVSAPLLNQLSTQQHTPVQKPVNKSTISKHEASAVKVVNKKNNNNALCIVLAILLFVQTTVVTLYGWPGFALGGGIAKNTTFTLAEGETSVQTDDGVKVDFGPYNSMDGEKISIKEIPSQASNQEGLVRTSYDITVGERSEFQGLLTITLPYNESETDAGDEEGSVIAEYYNEESGFWELVDYTVNTDDNTVTITTDHLSTYCTVTVQDAGSPYAMLSKFGSRLDDETALSILEEFEKVGQPGDVGNSLLLEMYSQILPQGYSDEEEAELLNDVLGWIADAGDVAAKNLMQAELGLYMADHVSKLPGKGMGYMQTIKLASKLEIFTLALSTVSLAETFYEVYKGDESLEGFVAQAYKLAYNLGMTLLDVKQITTGAMKLSMLGVIAIDYSLNKFMLAADQTYKDSIFEAVIAYNEILHPYTDEEWYAIILEQYKRHGNDSNRFKQRLDGIMYNFSTRYFYDDPEEQQVARNASDVRGLTSTNLIVTEAAREYCSDQYMARLGQRLQPIIEDVFMKIRYETGENFRSQRNDVRNTLNAPLIFEIIEEIPEGDESKYAGSVISLTKPGGNITKGWMDVLDKDGHSTIDATILGYIQAGIPTQLRLWLKGDDPSEDKPALTLEFKVTDKVTTIVLGNEGIDAKWFEGRWRYGDHFSFNLEIIDSENCRHIGTVDGQEIIHNSTYIFDPEAASLTIAYSPGRVSLLETTYYGYVDEGIDYIKSSNSSTIYERVK